VRKHLFNSSVKDKDLSSNTKSKISLDESKVGYYMDVYVKAIMEQETFKEAYHPGHA
jgi:hypothetical protein